MTATRKKIYYNDPQLEYMYTGAHTSVIAGGRRLGKSHGFAAPFVLRNTQSMPRSTQGVVGNTFQQLLSRTLPGTLQALEEMGYKRDLHFHIGHKPPKNSNFAKPIIDPPSYEHAMIWYNGTIWRFISQDRAGTSNSLTLDGILLDEAKFLKFQKLKEETFPANGGFRGHFGHIPWHHSMLIISDMPTTKAGSWFLTYKEKMDEELIDIIHSLIFERWEVQQRMKIDPKPFHATYLRELDIALAKLRSIAVYYREWSSIENLLLLGERYIKQMKRDLPPLVFQTSILCKKINNQRDNFYSAMQESIHYYDAYDNSYLDGLNYNYQDKDDNCLQDGDLDREKPICIAFDYNANINWLVAGQRHGVKMQTLKSFYVKYERKIRELVQDFCKYYRHHNNKTVIYYYDNTALGTNYAVGDDDFAAVICSEFERLNWSVERIHLGNPVPHRDKHRMIHLALKGQKYLFPLFNKSNNEALILALENTGVKITSKGFQKDKSGEKLGETEEDCLEHRTDGTDAWDTLFIGMNKFAVNDEYDDSIVSIFSNG
ncbi:hypothetical protein [Mangrovibacterium sp.]|uniref:hypothetical protein n=1 Tax=Mangrovibacterium sp. TaxID=1961364 RepID=UPI0035687369